MNLAGLIQQFRIAADDKVLPYLWTDEWLATWFTEAVQEAAIRARLLHESGSAAICQIAVSAGASSYPLHESLYEIDHIGFKATGASCRESVKLVSREELDRLRPGWRDRMGRVEFAIQSDAGIRLAFTPETDGILYLEGFRLPLNALVGDYDTPEINQAHHIHLLDWALHRAFSVPDTETVDKERATQAEQAFARYFGLRPDSDLRRTTRHDVEHHNRAHFI